jgi:hypothetical protein
MKRPQYYRRVLSVVFVLFAMACNPARHSKKFDKKTNLKRLPQPSLTEPERIVSAARAITELDLAQAQAILGDLGFHQAYVPLLRARLAISLGDCAGATSLLTNTAGKGPGTDSELERVAENCARAMSGAEVVFDESRGVWIRLQNSRDRVLVPLIAEVADRAALAIGEHLHVRLPRPLRIELVSDLLSLSHLTGLPLNAAETTGTVAIARFGKVTMLSPRATTEGYPWQDTLAHEIAHLVVTRASGDEAPLWLQEGIAKHEETAWRLRRPLDEPLAARRQARKAMLEGRQVGIQNLGASIALQPSPEAASTAYAEVESFYTFLRRDIGDVGLRLLLSDLRTMGARSVESALRSVTGYGLNEWLVRFQNDLISNVEHTKEPVNSTRNSQSAGEEAFANLRRLRLGILLAQRRHWLSSAELLTLSTRDNEPSTEWRWRWALAESKLGRLHVAAKAIGTIDSLPHLDGLWLARYARILEQSGQLTGAEEAFELSLSFAPTLERVACRGEARMDESDDGGIAFLPTREPFRTLCLDAIGTSGPSF